MNQLNKKLLNFLFFFQNIHQLLGFNFFFKIYHSITSSKRQIFFFILFNNNMAAYSFNIHLLLAICSLLRARSVEHIYGTLLLFLGPFIVAIECKMKSLYLFLFKYSFRCCYFRRIGIEVIKIT